jgi:NAD(P)-dependent dehydrogenase (short-subunit alcohol dehydrogenase family)
VLGDGPHRPGEAEPAGDDRGDLDRGRGDQPDPLALVEVELRERAGSLAAAGIGGFSSILGVVREKAPLRRAIETSEVGDAAAFLLSDAGRGITGEVLMVDSGFHVLGM